MSAQITSEHVLRIFVVTASKANRLMAAKEDMKCEVNAEDIQLVCTICIATSRPYIENVVAVTDKLP